MNVHWLHIVLIEAITLLLLFFIFIILYVIFPHKSRLVKKIESRLSLEYENFDKIINCTARNVGPLIFYSIFFYLFILVAYIGTKSTGIPTEFTIFLSLFFLFYAIIVPAVMNNKYDIIKVDPHNQTYIVRNKYIFFFYGKKQIYPWSDLEFDVIKKDKIQIVFAKHFSSCFQLSDDDYLQIMPKVFRALKSDNYLNISIALKALSMYSSKLKMKLIIAISLISYFAIMELVLLFIFV